MKKIIRVTTELNFGGIEKVFELHAKYYDNSYELIFVALGKGGNAERVLQDLGFKVIVLNINKATIPSPGLILTLVRTLIKEMPDVVHTAGAEANFHGTIAARIAGIDKIICEEIGIPEHSFKAKLLFRFVYLFSNKVIAISKAVQEFLVISKEVPVGKVQLLYNPVNEVSSASEIQKDKCLFTIVARLEPVKNISLLLGAFHEFLKKESGAKLNIIGSGSQMLLLQKQVEDLQIQSNVSFLGYIPNPIPLLAQSSFFILPSFFEGFGLACIEAIQAYNITICTNSGGIPEFIEDGKEGFLFNPNSKEALIEAMNRAVALSEGDKLKMLRAAKERVEQMFSAQKYVTQLNELYNSV